MDLQTNNPARLRILHSPENITGQATSLSRWQRQHGAVSETATYYDNPYDPPGDIRLSLQKRSIMAHLFRMFGFFLHSLRNYDLFNFYSGYSLLPLNLDLPFLRLLGRKITMTYCGTDVRLVSIEKRRNPFWFMLTMGRNRPAFDVIKRLFIIWHRLWVHRVIAPRGLYDSARLYFPPAKIVSDIWLHNPMDIAHYKPTAYRTNKVPLVVHAPSKTGIKGSRYVAAAVKQLQAEGFNFIYKRLHGLPYRQVHAVLRDEADIIVDQFIIGDFGTLAVEGMYYGKPVMCYQAKAIKAVHYPSCPLVNASLLTLKDKLAWLITHPEERIRIGKAGRAYVEKHFDREKLNQAIWDLYKKI